MQRIRLCVRRNPWYTALAAVVLLSTGFGIWLGVSGEKASVPFIREQPNRLSAEQAPSPLTGLLVSRDEARRYPVVVIIENHPDARPQSGLEEAGLVYEAYAEGSITRFLALYVDGNEEATLGPVRSVRTYTLDWASEINPILVHVGGNSDALARIPSSSVRDLDQFHNADAFTRVRTRLAPHNVYTTLHRLREKAEERYDLGSPSFPVFHFKDPLDEAQRPASSEFSVNYGGSYAVRWVYNKDSNAYARYLAGQPHRGEQSGRQIQSSNIIVQVVQQRPVTSRSGVGTIAMDTIGSGPARVYLDGLEIEATWRKSAGGKTRFYDANGEEIRLNRGKTWIEVVPPWVTFG